MANDADVRAYYEAEQASLPNCVQRAEAQPWDSLPDEARGAWAERFALRQAIGEPDEAAVRAFYEGRQQQLPSRHRAATVPWPDLPADQRAQWAALYVEHRLVAPSEGEGA